MFIKEFDRPVQSSKTKGFFPIGDIWLYQPWVLGSG